MTRYLPLFFLVLLLAATFGFRGQLESLVNFRRSPTSTASELSSRAYINRILSSNGLFDPNATTATWFNERVPLPKSELASLLDRGPLNVLGETAGDSKWVEVDLTTQHLFAHNGDRIDFDFPISSGLPWMPTVTGEFRIWAKLRSQRMTGGLVENGTFYDLPNVPFVQYFHNGYGLHGAYWHNDFGHPRSHGCVNISPENAEKLYYWTRPSLGSDQYARFNIKPEEGTKVVIHGVTPVNLN